MYTARWFRQAWVCRVVVIGVLSCLLPMPVPAHDGALHAQPSDTRVPSNEARTEARSDTTELVAIFKDPHLWIYVDDANTNQPVRDLRIEVESGAWHAVAHTDGDGIYSVPATFISAATRHSLIFTLTGGSHDDLLVTELAVDPIPIHAHWRTLSDYQALAATGMALLIVIAVLVWRRTHAGSTTAVGIVLLAGLLVGAANTHVHAHAGEDHGDGNAPPPAAPASTAHNPGGLASAVVRMPDGSVFLPKPAQRVLGVTTLRAQLGEMPRTVELPGQVIADPRYSGRIEAVQAGIVTAPDKHGLPNLGQRVRQGELLALLQPALSSIERARQQSELAEINRDLTIADQQYQRVGGQINPPAGEPAAPTADAPTAGLPQTPFSMIQTQVEALRARKHYLEASFKSPLPLTAPVAGVVSTSHAFVGNVVQPGETLIEIVDPLRRWVEVLSYDAGIGQRVVGARAHSRDGAESVLEYRGQGFQLREQAVPLQFALKLSEPLLAVGQPLRVVVELRDTLEGAIVPRSAVIRRANGDSIIWAHVAAERFAPQRVTVVDYDAGHMVVSHGLHAGDLIVTTGVATLEQTR